MPLNVLLRPLELRTLLNHCGAVEVDRVGRSGRRRRAGARRAADAAPPVHRRWRARGADRLLGALPRRRAVDAGARSRGRRARVHPVLGRAGRCAARDGARSLGAAARVRLLRRARAGARRRPIACCRRPSCRRRTGSALGLLVPAAWRARRRSCLPTRARPRTLFDVMAAFAPTIFAATPSLYAQLAHDYAELPAPRPKLMASVRHAISGGETLPIAVEKRVHELFGVELLHGFGVTEALVVRAVEHADVAARAVGGAAAAGHRGARRRRGRARRWRRGDRRARGARRRRSPGALRTGDRFLVDDDGYFFYCGRADDLFKVSRPLGGAGRGRARAAAAPGGVGVRGRRGSRRRRAAAAARVRGGQHRPRAVGASWRTS